MNQTKRFLCTLFVVLAFMPIFSWAQNQLVTIEIKNMTCSLCVSMINKSLRETPGVVKAKTSLPQRQAVVTVPHGYDLTQLLNAIEKTGYVGEVKSVEPIE